MDFIKEFFGDLINILGRDGVVGCGFGNGEKRGGKKCEYAFLLMSVF